MGTFWLKIEQYWPFEEIFIFSHGGHLGYRTALTDTQNCVRWSRLPTKMAAKLKIEKRRMKFKKIFSSETTEPISTKLCWNDPCLVMAAILDTGRRWRTRFWKGTT
jgi:hypothetical protein